MSIWARIRYRVVQFVQWIRDSMRPVDRRYVEKRLPDPALRELFDAMPRADQHHGITVARVLERRGWHDADLLAAAVLHDVGKTRAPVSVWARVMVVLGEWLMPRAAAQWSRGEARGLKRPFVVRRSHARWGAEMAREAGASDKTAALIRRHHQSPDGNAALAALHEADEDL